MVSVKISDAARARAYSAKAHMRQMAAICMVCGASGPVAGQKLREGWSWHPTGPGESAVCPRHTLALDRQRRIEALTLRDAPKVYGQMAGGE